MAPRQPMTSRRAGEERRQGGGAQQCFGGVGAVFIRPEFIAMQAASWVLGQGSAAVAAFRERRRKRRMIRLQGIKYHT